MFNEYGASTYAQIQYDMSVHINKENDPATLQFESSSYENVFIQTEWTIVAGGAGDAI